MNKIYYFFQVVQRLNYLLTRKQKIKGISAFIWMLLSSICELLGVSIIVPFIYALLSPEDLLKNKYIQFMMRTLGIESSLGMILVLAVLIVLVYILKNIMLIYGKYVQVKFQCQVQEDMALLMLDSYMKRDYSYFVDTNSSEISRGVLDDVENIFTILQTMFSLLAESLTVIIFFIYIVMTDWLIAVGMCCVMILCIVTTTFGFKNVLKREGERFRDLNVKKNIDLRQIILGIKDISVLQRKEHFIDIFKKDYDEFKKSRIITNVIDTVPERVIEALFITGLVLIVSVRIAQGVSMAVLVPKLASFAIVAFRLLPSINKFATGINRIVYLNPALNAAYDNVIAARKMIEKENESDSSNTILSFENELEICGVSWNYADSNRNVLENIYLMIKKGDAIAFIGESGSGKTTLANIILGIYQPKEGKVLVDGENIYSNLKQWATIISYVPQSVFLLDDTVRANIVFGYEEADDEKVWEALKQAQLKDFIISLPEGLDTKIGEEGAKLSGGQRQRLAIARALYTNPEILLLDEATAALDNETEAAVMEAIENLHGSKTLIIIAHRLSTIEKCNKVYEVKSGKLEDVTTTYNKNKRV